LPSIAILRSRYSHNAKISGLVKNHSHLR